MKADLSIGRWTAVAIAFAVVSSFVACDGGSSSGSSDVWTAADSTVTPPAKCIQIDRVNHKVYPPAGIRVTFRVLGCDGYPVKKLTDKNVTVVNDEKDQPFGAGEEGGGASAPDLPSEFGLYSILVLDMSNSIFKNQAVNDVIDGAKVFVQKMVEEAPEELKQRVAIMVFGMPSKTQVVQDFTDDAEVLNAKLEELRASDSLGTTDLYGALTKGLNEVQAEGQGLEIVERLVVILTDGTHEAGDEENMRQAALSAKSQAEANDVTVFSIGIKGEYDEQKIKELASKTDYFVLAENAAVLTSVFKTIAARVAAIAESNYVVGVCTPVVFGSPSLTIKVAVDEADTSTTVAYSTESLEGDVANCDPDLTADPCAGSVCGVGAIPGFKCGTCNACGTECSGGQCIFTACEGKECGDDGCDGSCGACQAGWQCGGDDHCFDPCSGKECGDDGYGNSCGSCSQGVSCQNSKCQYPYWTDPTSGLMWENPPMGGSKNLSQAKSYCENLNLGGYTDWELPTIGELRTLIRGCPATEDGGSCNVEEGDCLAWSCRDDSCKGCSYNDGPADGCYWPDEMQGTCSWYWSSSPVEGYDYGAWLVRFDYGSVNYDVVYGDERVRCVQ